MSIQDSLKNINFKDRVLACPAMGKTTRFQLVDEFGSGQPYAGLAFEVTDSEDLKYKGFLNTNGTGEVKNNWQGPSYLHSTRPNTEPLKLIQT